MKKLAIALFFSSFLALGSHVVNAEQIGSVDTEVKLLGPNHKIVVDAYDDPLVQGVTCHVSHAVAGGFGAAVGLSTDTSDASIACRQLGPISFNGKVPTQADVFSERLSPLFKQLRVVRMVDRKRNTLVYLTYSTTLIDGSPKNSVTTVPVQASTPIPVQ
jgi:CreA protein